MAIRILLAAYLLICSLGSKAQTFYHTIGGQYLQSIGTYGNYDRLSFQYNPQIHLEKKSLIYAVSFPVTYGIITSSARSDNKAVLELPVSIELGYNPNYPCIPYNSTGVFIGFGASKQLIPILSKEKSYFVNAVLGFRMRIRKVPFEWRFTVSRSAYDQQLKRFGIGLATEL